MTNGDAHALFGASFIGADELSSVAAAFAFGKVVAPQIPFPDETLLSASGTHVLLFAAPIHADGRPVSINSLRGRFGINPNISEPCFYNQDWYVREDFASVPLDGRWHLLPKRVLESARGKSPEKIRSALRADEVFPTAAVCAFAFFAYWLISDGGRLWSHDYLWCRDIDHHGDQVYVGRYEDPGGINQPGFNIHRHLSLRSVHSAAIELV
jgi:hypothetical protein